MTSRNLDDHRITGTVGTALALVPQVAAATAQMSAGTTTDLETMQRNVLNPAATVRETTRASVDGGQRSLPDVAPPLRPRQEL